MSNALATRQEGIHTVAQLLEKGKKQLQMALPKHMSVDRLQRIVLTSIQRNPELLNCSQASLMGAIVQSAQLGLEPDNVSGEAALVPYKGKIQLIPMYKGLMKLARRSGEIGPITAEVVYENDKYKMKKGLHPVLEHEPSNEPQKVDEIVAVYAVADYIRHDKPQFVWMWKWEVDEIRKRSPAGQKGPWVTDYAAMAKKTALRQLCKLLPSSPELQAAVHLDELADVGIPQNLDTVITVDDDSSENGGNGKSALDEIVDKETGEVIEEKPDPELEAKAEEQKKALEEAEKKEEKPKRGRPKKEQKDSVPNKSELNFD